MKKLIISSGFFKNMKGLAFRDDFKGECIFEVERPGAIMIHTFFMRFPVDITVLGKNDEVIKEIKNLQPWRLKFIWGKVHKTIERKSKC